MELLNNKKKAYEAPYAEIEKFSIIDIVTKSGSSYGDNGDEEEFPTNSAGSQNAPRVEF